MKKTLFVIIIVALVTLGAPSLGVNGQTVEDIDGVTLDTDIIVLINGVEIPSYNFNGNMLIPLEDLENYGFQVIKSELIFLEDKGKSYPKEDVYDIVQADIPKKPPVLPDYKGNRAGKAVHVGGIVFINEYTYYVTNCHKKRLHNVDGKLMVRVRDFEFSTNIFNVFVDWDENKRIASVTVKKKGDFLETDFGTLTIQSLEELSVYKDFEWFFESSEKKEFLTLYNDEDLSAYYSLAYLLNAMKLKYSLEDTVLTVERTPESKKELPLQNNIWQWIKQPVFNLKFVPCYELHPSFAPNEAVSVFSDKEGVLYISYTDIPKLTGISYFYDSERLSEITFYLED